LQNNLSDFSIVLLFIVGAVMFLLIGLLIAKIIRPNKPNLEKLSSYESGEEPLGDAWNKFNIRYYTIALIFVLFEAELIFLFPWGIISAHPDLAHETNKQWNNFAFVEMLIFVVILALGLAYAWANGYIDWVKPQPQSSDFKQVVPEEIYEKYQ
jgi:NADH-quinone oxidoreductase subunit A